MKNIFLLGQKKKKTYPPIYYTPLRLAIRLGTTTPDGTARSSENTRDETIPQGIIILLSDLTLLFLRQLQATSSTSVISFSVLVLPPLLHPLLSSLLLLAISASELQLLPPASTSPPPPPHLLRSRFVTRSAMRRLN